MDLFKLAGSVVLDASGVTTDLDNIKAKVKEVETTLSDSERKMQEFGGSLQKIGGFMTAAISVPLGILAKRSVDAGNAYEGQMNRVEAISGAVGDELQMLDDRAKELGKSSVFSASETAGAMEMMAAASFEALEIYDALPGVIDLAAVSGGNMGLASQAVSAAVNQFKLEAEDATHVADVFAKASAETNAQIEDMSEAMKNAGPMASSLGISLEETSAMIGLMANENIKGGLAGTTLKNAMLQLTGASDEAKAIMNKLGVEVFNTSTGKMNPMSEIIQKLREKTMHMTDEQKQHTIATIFGRQAISGMMALINTAPGELEEMTQGLIDSDDAASDMADTMNKGVPGALASMRSSFESAQIAIQEALAPLIIIGAKIATFVADTFTAMPKWLQVILVAVGGIMAILGPLIVVLGTVAKNIVEIKTAITLLGAPFMIAGAKIVLVIAAIVAVITIITSLIGWVKDLGITWESIWGLIVSIGEISKVLIEAPIRAIYGLFTWLIESILGLFGFEFEFPSILDAAKKAWEGVKDFFSWSLEGIKSLFSFDWLTGGGGSKPKPKGGGERGGGRRLNWNAKGGIFNEPTIFDTANAGLQGVGEAGAEAIIPLSPNVLAGIGEGIDTQRDNSQMLGIISDLAKEVKAMRKEQASMKIEMDGRAVGGIVTPYVDDNLGKKRHFSNNRF